MNHFLLMVFAIGAIIGIMNGINSMSEVRANPSTGVKPSANIFTFFLFDNYK